MQAIVAVIFITALFVTALGGALPIIVLALYAFASTATFILYAHDKRAAERNQWRTRERTLHAFSLAGGWPGALLAQSLLRHKSQKQSFRAVFWLTVILNCLVLGWGFFPVELMGLR